MLNILVVTSIGKIFSNLTQVSRTDLLNAAAYPCCTLKVQKKKWAAKVCFFSCRATFHGHHWWRVLQTFWLVTIHRMVVWIIFWRWHYYPQSPMEIRSLTWCWFQNKFFVGNVLLLLGGNYLIWRAYFSQLGWFNHQLQKVSELLRLVWCMFTCFIFEDMFFMCVVFFWMLFSWIAGMVLVKLFLCLYPCVPTIGSDAHIDGSCAQVYS